MILGKDLVFLKGPCLALADPGSQKQIDVGRRELTGDILIQTTTKNLQEIMSLQEDGQDYRHIAMQTRPDLADKYCMFSLICGI